MPDQPQLFDTHLHFDPEDDPAAILAAARAVGVTEFLVVGTGVEDSRRAQLLTTLEPGLVAAAGVHPHEAEKHAADLAPFDALMQLPGVVAVGEIGLDYHYDHSPRDVQRRVFSHFLQLAIALRLPAVIHCRDAYTDLHPMLQEAAAAGLRFVIHSFTGTPQDVEQLLPLGAFFGINGMVTFNKAVNIREALAAIPTDRLLLETDAPWLAPVPHRGRRNQPAFLPEILQRAAAEKGVSAASLAATTTQNARDFLDLRGVSLPVPTAACEPRKSNS